MVWRLAGQAYGQNAEVHLSAVSERFHQLVAFNRHSGSHWRVWANLPQKKFQCTFHPMTQSLRSQLSSWAESRGRMNIHQPKQICMSAETLAYSVTQTSAWGGADDSEGEEVKSGQIGPRRATAGQHSLLSSSGMAHVRRRTACWERWRQHQGQSTKLSNIIHFVAVLQQ